MPASLVVLISGGGSNLLALLEAIDAGQCDAWVRAVVSDRASAAGLSRAEARNIATHVVSPRDYADRTKWSSALADVVAPYAPDLIVLAGFMRIVDGVFLERFPRRVINVHPALLPLFPGADGPAQAVAAGVRVSGCTVHLVDSGVDTGPIISQAVVPVLPEDDANALHARIQTAEHRLLPATVHAIACGHITLDPTIRAANETTDAEQRLFSLKSAREPK